MLVLDDALKPASTQGKDATAIVAKCLKELCRAMVSNIGVEMVSSIGGLSCRTTKALLKLDTENLLCIRGDSFGRTIDLMTTL